MEESPVEEKEPTATKTDDAPVQVSPQKIVEVPWNERGLLHRDTNRFAATRLTQPAGALDQPALDCECTLDVPLYR
jgi:hypothetical protein